MERLGKVGEWNDERGHGFIHPLDEAKARVFFHVRDYRQDGRRPEAGEVVKFTAHRQDDGKWRASAVRRAAAVKRPAPASAARHARSRARLPAWFPWTVLMAAVAALGWAIRAGRLPFELAFVFAGLSAVTCVVYALDKHAARTRRWRTRESTLHALELAGGWPGALVAQQLLRHKSRKPGYRIVFWCMVALNIGALAAWVLTRG